MLLSQLASHKDFLVPKLQLGNREAEAPASRDWKLELSGLHSQAGAWERVQFDR